MTSAAAVRVVGAAAAINPPDLDTFPAAPAVHAVRTLCRPLPLLLYV